MRYVYRKWAPDVWGPGQRYQPRRGFLQYDCPLKIRRADGHGVTKGKKEHVHDIYGVLGRRLECIQGQRGTLQGGAYNVWGRRPNRQKINVSNR
jgi:hypothetical protein